MENKETIIANIESALDDIRNVLARDGGGIELVELSDEGVVSVRLQGHCVGCAGAQMTLRMVVQQILEERVPEVTGVVSVD